MIKSVRVSVIVLGIVCMVVHPVVADVQLLQTIGSFGVGDGQFYHPCGIAVDSSGNIWATDSLNDRVQEFSASGQFILGFGTYGHGNGQLYAPRGIAVDPSGNVWVADGGNNRIQKFSATGQFLQAINTGFPRGIAVDRSGNVWETDLYGSCVNKFSSSGELLLTFGGLSRFDYPEGIAVDSAGNVLVADKSGDRVQKFSGDGQFIQSFAQSHLQTEDYNGGLAVDPYGNIWGTAKFSDSYRIYEMSSSGVVLHADVGAGTQPQNIAFDASGHLWVADPGFRYLCEFTPEPGTLSLLALGGLGLLRRRRTLGNGGNGI